ncbi:hypothetical protein FDI29_gp31 [Arthrobacter phage Abidatro]|uniref:Uncharacterized protein n=1 Tax=Arthrobacter phage Abidatro TaxID=2015853 RepID=A0A222ZG83_9CAUD|nr:hypothetical protein FDI29_gp31 [Arthrobacter phage Abidatro]ASR83201.1 hypothetical protein SEA_ABIDATRO_31 [Arthrobacter phage Abidatro]
MTENLDAEIARLKARTGNWTSHVDYADRMKSEILALIAAGTVPESVGSFSELHDYIDANMLAHDVVPAVDLDDEAEAEAHGEEWARKFNAASVLVNEWLRNGGHQVVTVTITARWPRAEWLKFAADHDDLADVADSFDARLNEVFSQNEVLTGAEVLTVTAE